MDITVVPEEKIVRDDIPLKSLKDVPKTKVKEYEAEQKTLSKNIQAFDKRPKVYTENPFSYNSVSLKKKESAIPSVDAQEMITNPGYNLVGKFLGVDTIHDWNKEFHKVYAIVEWARKELKTEDPIKIIRWVQKQANHVPNVGNKHIDNLYIFSKIKLQ